LDRLTSLYRSNGYYGFNKENLLAEIDTVDTKLLEIITLIYKENGMQKNLTMVLCETYTAGTKDSFKPSH
jgi:hypothetical protein